MDVGVVSDSLREIADVVAAPGIVMNIAACMKKLATGPP